MFNLFGFKPKKEANEEDKKQDTESDLNKHNKKIEESFNTINETDFKVIASLYKDINDAHFNYLNSKKIKSDAKTEQISSRYNVTPIDKNDSLIKNYKIEVRHILDNILFKIADATKPKTNTRSKLFFGNDFLNKDLINKKFKYVFGFYNIPEISKFLLSNNIGIILSNSIILEDTSNLNNYIFTFTKNTDDDMPDNEIEFTIDDGTKVTFKKTLSERDYPGNSIYGHIFEQIEDEPNDAKSQPSEEPTSGGKRTRRKNRRRRHQKSRKNRKSRRRI